MIKNKIRVSLFRFFQGGPQFHEVVHHMATLGYVVYDIFGGHDRPLDHALAQIDLVFAKEQGFFRQSHDYATPESRRVMAGKVASKPKGMYHNS